MRKIVLVCLLGFSTSWAASPSEPQLHPASQILLESMRAQSRHLQQYTADAANAQTPGFKSQSLGVRGDGHSLSSVGRVSDVVAGVLETDEPLDFLIEGPGYFVLQAPWGEEVYTRDGRFKLDQQGVVVSAAYQFPLLLDSGPFVLAAGDPFKVSSTGHILVNNSSIGQIRLLQFSGDSPLLALTGSLLRAAPDASPPQSVPQSRIKTGFYEGAAVDLTKIAVGVSGIKNRYDALVTALQKKISGLSGSIQAANQ